MHGLINRAIQSFYRDTYGRQAWSDIVRALELPFSEFEPMLHYDASLTYAMLDEMSRALDKPCEVVLEDLGTYLVSHPNLESLRRLLRFGGVSFVDFLHSLDDLPGRARLAVEDLELPDLELREHGGRNFSLTCHSHGNGFGYVLVGILRALADDYGALIFLEHRGGSETEAIDITVFETEFAEGREFDLGAEAG
ncbi:heme NO-binding domain-containing protein [Primorskyibacter sp. S187A]|uniref:heme NO-binding domain-containing protein n=1 Tax=Primorskyibacter sp. S187A TaxID=3415130 RepID=UPI003C7CAAB5